ncbi:NAD-dependent epimerase/dehydratase family protein (plasmid) [Rhizobium sp. WL3]|uniref:D-erythronate dehydrogenase n=1 Tax=Rhizobium sp. WL3 TaxID=2603277 RepID=UPI0011C1DBA7|nr:D-erythronate dehydrogenase [Rhizobium sp. WL3]QEE43245.1 NAD-dependent epimerase/dehydratase family protein [Rhizobium sp. WL3]
MHVLIIGAAGMIGHRLAARLAAEAALGGQTISRMTLLDIVKPNAPDAAMPCDTVAGSIEDPAIRRRILDGRPAVIFQLAAIVSGAAEADFDLGWRVNVAAVQALYEDIRSIGYAPRLITTSSVAVFGGDLPDPVPDTHHLAPQSSYGAQKAVGELILADFTRKGFVDGRTVRLPTIVVRPGAPNAAASSFVSGIIREPLKGERARLPVARDSRVWIASPDLAVASLIHAATLAPKALGAASVVTVRGLTVSVQQMIDALALAAGPEVAALIDDEPDPAVAAIVGSWPQGFDSGLAVALGFPTDDSIEQIIARHIAEHHPHLARA